MASQSYELSTESTVILAVVGVLVFLITLAVTIKSIVTIVKCVRKFWSWLWPMRNEHIESVVRIKQDKNYAYIRKEE